MKTEDKAKPKPVIVIVNGRQKEVDEKELSFVEIVQLAFPGETPTDTIVFTVAYSQANGNKDGTLVNGEELKVKKGMIINVSKTDKS